MLDRFLDFIRDVPIGTLIFLVVIAWSFLGRKTPETASEPRRRRPQAPPEPQTYASDERREREQWGHLDFGTPDDRYGDANEWGQTKYGFEPTEWGFTFDDPDDKPRIR